MNPESLAKLLMIQYMFGDSDQNNPTNLLFIQSELTSKKLFVFDFGRYLCHFKDPDYTKEINRLTNVDFTEKDLNICSIPWCRNQVLQLSEDPNSYFEHIIDTSQNPFVFILKTLQKKGSFGPDTDLKKIEIPLQIIDNILKGRKNVEGILRVSKIYTEEELQSNGLPFQDYYNLLEIKKALPEDHPHKPLTLFEIITGYYNLGNTPEETERFLLKAHEKRKKYTPPSLEYITWLSGKFNPSSVNTNT